jgi:predicted transcriptional regulator
VLCVRKAIPTVGCKKKVRTLKDGGYYHVYMVAKESQVEKQLDLRVKEMIGSLVKLIDHFASDFHKQFGSERT